MEQASDHDQAQDKQRSNGIDLSPTATVQLGQSTLYVNSHELQRNGATNVLEPKQLAVLLELIKQRPQTVSHETLMKAVWPGVVVGDNVIHQAIAALRKALGDNAKDPSYILTQARRGYRWVGPVAENVLVNPAVETAVPESTRSLAKAQWHRNWGRRTSSAVFALTVLLAGAWLIYSKTDSAPTAAPSWPPALVIWVAPFEAGARSDASPADLARYRDQLRSELLKSRTVVLTEDPEKAQYGVSGLLGPMPPYRSTRLRLTDLRDQTPLWEQVFDHSSTAQGDQLAPIGAKVVGQIALLFATERAVLSKGVDPRVARAHVHGQIEWHTFALGAGGNPLVAVDHFKESVRLDPNFWLAQQQLTILYANRLGPPATFEAHHHRTMEAAERLLELSQVRNIGASALNWEAVLAIVSNRQHLDYDFTEQMWQRARERGWNSGQVHVELAGSHAARGDFDTAIQYYQAALAGDAQLNQSVAGIGLGYTLIALNRLAEARTELSRTAANLQPGTRVSAMAQVYHALALALLDDPMADAVLNAAWHQYGASHSDLFPGILALRGRVADARRVLTDMERTYQSGTATNNWPAATGHLFLGEPDKALLWLNRAIENRESTHIAQIKKASYLNPLREHAAFQAALQRLKEIESSESPLRALLAKHDLSK